jgi:hypothetical protein
MNQVSEDFCFFIPATFEKGGDGKRIVRGFVSTEHQDREDETILQDGLDFTEFMNFGWFNDNHSKSTADKIGYPTLLEARAHPDGKKGHYVEGVVLSDYEPADKIWGLHRALKSNKAPRTLGFSIEGAIQRRTGTNGKIISKAKVRNVAITADPINPYAGLEAVVKGLTAGTDVSAPPATPGQGFPLRAESLGKKRKRRMSHGESIDHLMAKGHSYDTAVKIVKFAGFLKTGGM